MVRMINSVKEYFKIPFQTLDGYLVNTPKYSVLVDGEGFRFIPAFLMQNRV